MMHRLVVAALLVVTSSVVAAAQPVRRHAPRRLPVATAQARSPFAACAAVLREPRHCVALAGRRILAIGLDGATSCAGPEVDVAVGDNNASLGWVGDRLYTCRNGAVLEIRLSDGATRTSTIACESVTSSGGQIVVKPKADGFTGRPYLERYASAADLFANRPAARVAASTTGAILATRDDVGYYARHATDELHVVSWKPYTHPASVPLDREDAAVHGMDVLRDGTLVLAGPSDAPDARGRGTSLRMFDATTGAKRGRPLVLGDLQLAGLKCN